MQLHLKYIIYLLLFIYIPIHYIIIVFIVAQKDKSTFNLLYHL